jgi:hypothetical protein
MRRRLLSLIFTCLVFGINTASAGESLNFDGKWCGKWDGEFDVCFEINENANKPYGYQVIYSWTEFTDRPQLTKELTVDKVNANSFMMGNKVLIFSHLDPKKAFGVGLFDQVTRLAPLVRQ